jgi:hypothetical protein
MENLLNKEKKIRSVLKHCDYCNFNAHSPTEWIKHVKTEKHKRKGVKLSDNLICEVCGLVSINTFNHNVHQILVHGTPDDRRTKAKFYCEDCDIGFFCKLYYDKHILSKRHSNMVEYNKLINEAKNENNSKSNESNIKLYPIPNIDQLLSDTNFELELGHKLLNQFYNPKSQKK